jgi:hypothetical protein
MMKTHLALLLTLLICCGCQSEPEDTAEFFYTRTDSNPVTFFFDRALGDNGNDGLSEDSPLRDLWTLDYIPLVPGDTVALKRGSVWSSDRIMITESGTEDLPITITAYGSGADPSLANTEPFEPAIGITGSHVAVSEITIAGTDRAPGIQTGADTQYVAISDCEISHTGIGVTFRGSHHTLSGSAIHDLNMIRDTSGGDDDYGANGVFIEGSDITVTGNTFRNCKSHSYDYDTDGGTIELWKNCSGIVISRNWSEGNNGFMEIGGQSGDSVSGILIHHNVSLNDMAVFVPHFEGTFGTSVSGIRFENNTIIVTADNQGYSLFYARTTVITAAILSVRNNIFVSSGTGSGKIYALGTGSSFTHQDNLYNLAAGSIGADGYVFTADPSEITEADPLFADPYNLDFRLGSGSPAINGGADLGYTEDHYGETVPWGTTAPDMGACESAF